MKISPIQLSVVVGALLVTTYLGYRLIDSSSPETIQATTMPAETPGPSHLSSPSPAPGAQKVQQQQVQQRRATPVVTVNEYEEPAEEPRDDFAAQTQWEEEYNEQMETIEAVSQPSPSSAIPSQLPDTVDDTDEGFVATTVRSEMIDAVAQIRDNYSWETETQREIEFLDRFLTNIGEQEEDTPEGIGVSR